MERKQGAQLADWASGRVVHVVIPVDVAFDLGRMQKVTASILERMGCSNCYSGLNIQFEIARQFVVDKQLNIREAVSGGGVIVDG